MGCAGGIDFTSNLALTREAIPAGFQSFKVTLKVRGEIDPAGATHIDFAFFFGVGVDQDIGL